jgi:hypothetical protein
MASALVRLKEGKSYTYSDGPNPIKFTADRPTPVVGQDLIDRLKTISCLAVEENQDKPVTPLAAKTKAKPAPAPEPEPEEEPEVQVETEVEVDGDAEVAVETTVEVEPAPEPAKPAKKGFFGGKGKKGS